MVANLVKFVDSAAWSIRAKKVTRRLAWLRHLETLLAFLGGGIWMAGYWPSSAPRNGPVRSWRELSLFLADGRNSLLLLGAGSVLLYHVMSFSLSQLHAAQVRADGLHRAAARGDAEALSRLVRELEGREVVSCPRPATSYLLAGGINALNSEGWAPVHLAATAGADRALRVLLRSRAEVSAVGAGRATPLMLSAEAGHDKTLRLLLASGALQGISLENSDGNTALHLAVREGHSECIHRLLRARADPSAINAQGVTPFGITRCQKFTESVLNSSQLSTRDAFFEVFNQRSVARTSEVEDPQDACQPLPSSASSRRASPVMTPRRSATGSPTLTVRSCGSVLDVPVVAAEDSALEELFAEATRGGLRLSNANAISSVVTEGTSRSSPTPPNELGGVPVKITGLACLVAVASPGVLRRLVAEPVGPRGSESLQEDNKLSYFRIVGLVGEGSFGSVYEACDMRPSPGGSQVLGDRRCALKILHRRQYLAQDMLARAKRERQVLKAARHPFIVRLLCAFRTPGNEMALVMEYCPNGNLNDLIVRKGRPGLSEAITRKLLAEVLLALAYLHDELDVVFGDVKPDNIVLDTCMHAKLTDFGLAKVNVSRGGGSCGFEGSMFFVAPEVTPAAARYSPAVDIYALGLVAWVCLTGGRPTEVLEERSDAIGWRPSLLGITSNSRFDQGQKSGREQRLPPVSHEALRNWLDERRSKAETRATPRELSDLAFSFVDTTTESEPLKRGRASDLRDHPFFVESDFSPRLHDSGDWAALLPACDWPRSPGSVATQDSWSWSGPRS
ncbi:Sucrose non-fermenting protein kinase 1 [Durusdinium trenchii]|uniref:non-specific serine/threonine protein kinase n=1 Tax=Durusdinium trenchii TaxID=1381693 RepID=A0ABP0K3J7_9DINO